MVYLPAQAIAALAASCVRMNVLSYDPSVGASVWALRAYAPQRTTDASLARLASHAPSSITALDLSGCTLVSDAGLCALLPVASRLAHLDLSLCPRISHVGLDAVARHGHALLTATLPAPRPVPEGGHNGLLLMLADTAPDLVVLDIDGWVIQPSGLAALLTSASALEALTVSLRPGPGITPIDDAAFVDIVQHVPPSLSSLELHYPTLLSAQSIAALLTYATTLSRLSLHHASFPKLALTSGIARSLRVIQFNHVDVDDVGLASLVGTAPALVHIEVRFCSYLSDAFLTTPFPTSLQSLILMTCPISDEGVAHIAAQIPSLPRLLCLDFSHTNITAKALPILTTVGKSVPYIGIADCAAIASSAIIDFYHHRQKQLKRNASFFLSRLDGAEPPSRFHTSGGSLRTDISFVEG